MRILVAMSGGIDSSVVAHMLATEGHEVIGVRFALWSDPLAPALAQLLPSKCCNAQTAARTRSVADKLNIPLHIVDLENEFKKEVVDPFLDAYREGLTPNPCIGCNRDIKFGKLLELADSLGCDRLATGHYARVARESVGTDEERYLLLEAVDKEKDQSYYLYGLTQKQLQRVVFPLGTMLKRDVFVLAKQYDVPFDEQYKESQDLCFFPEKTPHDFLRRHLSDVMRAGEIVRRDGTVVGTHQGLAFYTIGQRRGLGIGGLKIPLEVVSKDTKRNRLIVSEKGLENTSTVTVGKLRWISWKPEEKASLPFECRTRSLSPKRAGHFTLRQDEGTFTFSTSLPPQTPGQSLVLYRGEEIVGGGVITK